MTLFCCDNLLAEEHHRGAVLAEPARPNQLGPGVARAVEENLLEGEVRSARFECVKRILPGNVTMIFAKIMQKL